MSLTDVIGSLATGNYLVTRHAHGTVADSIYTTGAVTTFTIEACIQPATGLQRVTGGRDMRSKEDGQLIDDMRVMFTTTKLTCQDSVPGQDPDIVTFDDGEFLVFRVEPWDLGGDVYYHCVMTRRGGGT